MAVSTAWSDEVLQAAEPALVFCPLGFERRALLRFAKLPVVTTGPGAEGIHRAFAARDGWPVRNPRLVVLCGLAGALNPDLAAGGAWSAAVVVGTPLLPARLASASARAASIVEASRLVSTPQAKAVLRSECGADLVDLESRAFAECAAAARLPFAIVRGVGDGAQDALPAELADLVDAHGETRLGRTLVSLLRRPALLGELLPLARRSRAAMRDAAFLADAFGALPPLALCTPQNPFLLYGGSFDPPHERHASMLVDAMRTLGAPCADVMPAAINPLKSDTPPADPDARLAMCRVAFANLRGAAGEVRLSRLEIAREGPSFTIDTVEALCAAHPHLRGAIRFLIGSDALRSIERWHRWRELLALARPAVVLRPPDTRDAVVRFLAEFAASSGFADAPSWLLDLPAVDLASTEIRAGAARGERPAGLSDGVWREITARGLYGFGRVR